MYIFIYISISTSISLSIISSLSLSISIYVYLSICISSISISIFIFISSISISSKFKNLHTEHNILFHCQKYQLSSLLTRLKVVTLMKSLFEDRKTLLQIEKRHRAAKVGGSRGEIYTLRRTSFSKTKEATALSDTKQR